MKTIARISLFALAAAMLAPAALSRAEADDSKVALAGRGPRREALSAMQYKPFDVGLFDKLSEWSAGKPLSAEAIKGKPVLIVSWASWFKASHAGLKTVQSLSSKYDSMGLVVLAVHNPRGFEKAKAAIDEQASGLPFAHDTKGDFGNALKFDGAGPEFYVIDRAGRLRFANVNRDSVEAATELVVKESTSEAAAATPPTPKSPAEGGDAKDGNGASAAGKLPPSAYANVAWPKANSDGLSAKNVQGKPFPGQLTKAKYIGLVPNTGGKIVVLDFWATWCAPCREAIPKLEKIAKEFEGDAVVIGLTSEDETTVKKFLAKGKHEYYQGLDLGNAMNTAMGIQGIPHVVVLSTDGYVRYQGHPADAAALKTTIATLIKVDPGVLARKKADEAEQGK